MVAYSRPSKIKAAGQVDAVRLAWRVGREPYSLWFARGFDWCKWFLMAGLGFCAMCILLVVCGKGEIRVDVARIDGVSGISVSGRW